MKSKLGIALCVAFSVAVYAALIFHTAQAGGETAKQTAQEIHVDNFSFGPSALTVTANSTVSWVNKDDVPHVIASTDGLFKSKALDTDDKYTYTFSKPGTYSYFCSIHPKMVGKIIVQ